MASQKSRTAKGTGKDVKYKKPSCAPKRFKSAYMFYSERKHKELRQREECKKMRTADVAKLVSRAWKSLASSERLVFLDMAKRDKERYEKEKANYKGPWKVIDVRDRNGPKRPMSAFLAFSNARRKEVTEANPMLTNGEISKILADMWRDAPLKQKQLYQDEESKLRQRYKDSMSKRNGIDASGTSSPVLVDCVSVSSSSKTQSDILYYQDDNDDDQSLLSFASVLEPFNDDHTDSMSNFSRGHSISENTAKVTIPDEGGNPMRNEMQDLSAYMMPVYNSAQNSGMFNPMELPELDTPYPLKPLISTDIGSFLAAAAILDSSSDSLLFG